MKLYLDDDVRSRALAALLRKRGHEVVLPTEVGMAGKDDFKHMVYALEKECVLLSRNYRDFEGLHEVIQASGGHHHGILLVRLDNDRVRDMKPGGVAAAVDRLAQAGAALVDQVHVLNRW